MRRGDVDPAYLRLLMLTGKSTLHVMTPIGLEANGGVQPYRWMVDEILMRALPGGTPSWSPDGPSFAHISVTDATGPSSTADVRVR